MPRRGNRDGRGGFAFGGLAPARYRVLVDVPAWGVWSTDVLVRAGARADVVVEVVGGNGGGG